MLYRIRKSVCCRRIRLDILGNFKHTYISRQHYVYLFKNKVYKNSLKIYSKIIFSKFISKIMLYIVMYITILCIRGPESIKHNNFSISFFFFNSISYSGEIPNEAFTYQFYLIFFYYFWFFLYVVVKMNLNRSL